MIISNYIPMRWFIFDSSGIHGKIKKEFYNISDCYMLSITTLCCNIYDSCKHWHKRYKK